MSEPRHNVPWVEAEDTLIRRLWNEGVGTRQIAEQVNWQIHKAGVRTKNAIIGRARRIGVMPRPSPIKHERTPRPKKRSPETKVLTKTVFKKSKPLGPLPRAIPLHEIVPANNGLGTPTPTAHQCLWPLWGNEHTFGQPRYYCGLPKGGALGAYCEAHRAIAYTKPKPKETSNVGAVVEPGVNGRSGVAPDSVSGDKGAEGQGDGATAA